MHSSRYYSVNRNRCRMRGCDAGRPLPYTPAVIENMVEPVTLKGRHVCLVPLVMEHCEGLRTAVRDGELWKLWYTSAPRAGSHGSGDRAAPRALAGGVDAAVYRPGADLRAKLSA